METGKSIRNLLKHIRNNHHIVIGKRRRDKQDLLHMGYFHGYKACKFIKTKDNPLNITDFKEIINIYNLDNDLKALLYPVVMKIETAINNYVIDCIVSDDYTDIESILKYKLNHYADYNKNSVEYHREIIKYLQLKQSMYGVISKGYNTSLVIRHYIKNNEPVPLWALFELTTLGDLGNFISRLNNDTRRKLSKQIGIYNSKYDYDCKFLANHVYTIKNLRNSIAHNTPVFDCRFNRSKVAKGVRKHLEENIGVDKIDFVTITDYALLLAYYMKCLNFTKTEVIKFVNQYIKIVNHFKKQEKESTYIAVFGVLAQLKIQKFIDNY